MKLRRIRTAKRGRIEIIPMIDVMFFLLATFMLASLSMQRLDAVGLNLPSGKAEQIAENQPLTLSVTRDGGLLVNHRPVKLDDVATAVRQGLQADGKLVVAADAAAPHGLVMQAMLQARAGGAEHFLMAVQREP